MAPNAVVHLPDGDQGIFLSESGKKSLLELKVAETVYQQNLKIILILNGDEVKVPVDSIELVN